jgi:hypothetical protein
VSEGRTWTLIGADGKPYQSERPGSLGGHRARKLYGLFNCPPALRAIARGGYVKNRVFFQDEAIAVAAGYRPCAVCLPEKYSAWKAAQPPKPTTWEGNRSRRLAFEKALRENSANQSDSVALNAEAMRGLRTK